MLNVVALHGRLSRPAELRLLPTGTPLLSLEVTTRRHESVRAESVPVSWPDAPASATSLDAGDEVVVVGHVARRFFRAGGVTQSRTEVVASMVVPRRSAKRAEAVLRAAAAAIEERAALGGAGRGGRAGADGGAGAGAGGRRGGAAGAGGGAGGGRGGRDGPPAPRRR